MLIAFPNSLEPDQAQQMGLIWIKTVWHSDGFARKTERIFRKKVDF